MSVWDRFQPLTETENERLDRMIRMPKGVLSRDERVKMERLMDRRKKTLTPAPLPKGEGR